MAQAAQLSNCGIRSANFTNERDIPSNYTWCMSFNLGKGEFEFEQGRPELRNRVTNFRSALRPVIWASR
jgi:hypothetical protein